MFWYVVPVHDTVIVSVAGVLGVAGLILGACVVVVPLYDTLEAIIVPFTDTLHIVVNEFSTFHEIITIPPVTLAELQFIAVESESDVLVVRHVLNGSRLSAIEGVGAVPFMVVVVVLEVEVVEMVDVEEDVVVVVGGFQGGPYVIAATNPLPVQLDVGSVHVMPIFSDDSLVDPFIRFLV